MLKRKGFYGLVLAIVVLTLFLPACFKLGGEPSIDAKFTLTREISLMGISEFAFSVDVKGVKDAAVVEFDNGMPSVALSGGKAESRFFANIGTGEVTLSVRDSRGVELLKKTVTLEETKSTFDMAAVEDKTGIYVLIDDELIFYSLECLENMTFAEKVELLIDVILVNDSYVVIQSGEDAWIWDFATYPNNPKYDLTQDTLDMLGLPNYALAICEGGFFNILNGKSLYILDLTVVGDGEVTVDPEELLYEEGTEVSLTALAGTGWYFGGWTGDLESSDPEETIVMDEDKAITANFVEEFSPYIVGYSYEPDPVCEGTDFEITVEVQNAEVVEITFEGETEVAEKNGDIYTASFTAPMVSLNTFKPLAIKATNVTKSVTKDYAEGIYVLNSEGAIEILNFWYEEFDCDDTGTYLYIKTCCNPDPVYFDILVEGPFETEPEFVSKELIPGECEYLITFWWEFGTVACADATLTAVVKDYCGNTDEWPLVIEDINGLTNDDVIFIGFDPEEVPCDATTLTFPVKINYFDILNVTKVELYACWGTVEERFVKEAELLTTGEATVTYNFPGYDCEEMCVTVRVWAEDCGECELFYELCYTFDIDNVPPEDLDGEHVDVECNTVSTEVTWDFYDSCFYGTTIAVTHGNLFHYEEIGEDIWDWVNKGQFVEGLGYEDDGNWKWEFPNTECEDITITITGEDDCGNTTTWTETFFVDNVAPVVEFDLGEDICSPTATSLVFSWTISDCQEATFTGIKAIFNCGFDDAFAEAGYCGPKVDYELSEDGLSGTATLTWAPVDCCELVVTVYATDACGNIGYHTDSISVDNLAPVIEYFGVDEEECVTGRSVYINYEVEENCLDYVMINVSKGCLDRGIDCFTWICESDCWSGEVLWKLPEIDCEVLTYTITAVDYCGHTTTKEATVLVDNMAPSIELDILEPDHCATFTTFNWDVTDNCIEEVILAVSYGTLDATPLVYTQVLDGNGGVLVGPTGNATWTFEDLDCVDITLTITAIDSCGNETVATATYNIDNVRPKILSWEFDMEPVPDPEELCDVVYNSPTTLLTWEATDGCPEDFVIEVTAGFIEHWEDVDPDPNVTNMQWVSYGQKPNAPWKNDEDGQGNSNWRWNISGLDCQMAEITFTAWDACGETSDGTEIKIDTLAPDISLEVEPYEPCEAECVTLTWEITSEDCLVCNDNCIEWWVGTIEANIGTIDGQAKKQISVPCDCSLPISRTVTWCFGEIDCGTTLVATFTAWDAAGNEVEAVVVIDDIDTRPPEIIDFSFGDVKYDINEDPYLELSWEATDNCFNIASVWVSQGSLEATVVEPLGFDLQAGDFFVPDDFTDQYISKKWKNTIYWFLDDPEAPGTAWIAVQDVCCNEATATVSFEGFFNLDVTWEGEGWAGNGGANIEKGTIVELTAEASPCWEFVEWQISDPSGNSTSSDNPLYYTIVGNATIEAVFELLYFDVTVSSDPTAGGSVTDLSGNYACGTELTLTATPDSCYNFDGWFVDDTLVSTNTEYTFTVTEDVDIEARFTIKSYDVVFVRSHSGTALTQNPDIRLDGVRVFDGGVADAIRYSTTTSDVVYCSSHTLEAVERTGVWQTPDRIFVTWTLEGGVSTSDALTSKNISIELTGDATITATFAAPQ